MTATRKSNAGRPRGPSLLRVLQTIAAHGPMPLCDVVSKSQLGYPTVQDTLNNAVRLQQVKIVGYEKRPHHNRSVALYACADGDASKKELNE